MPEIKELYRQIFPRIDQTITTEINKLISIYRVQSIDEVENQKTLSVIDISTAREINNVRLTSIGLGNGRGIIRLPKVDDICLCLNLNGEYFYLLNVYDIYTDTPDNQVLIDNDSLYIINKSFGSTIGIGKNDDIALTTITGSKVRLCKNGGFKIFDKNNYGFESDGNGNLQIFGNVTFNGSVNGLIDAEGRTVNSNNNLDNGSFP